MISASTTVKGVGVTLSCTASENIAISGGFASTNNTGTFINQTWTSSTGAMTYSLTWETTVGDTIAVIWYANDTAGNWGTSMTAYFVLTSSTGWGESMNGIPNNGISSINGISKSSITSINGVT